MKKYIVSILIASVFLIGVPFVVQKASAADLSVRDFINLLITIGVIAPDKVSAVNAFFASLEATHPSQPSIYPVCGSASNAPSTLMPATSTLCSIGDFGQHFGWNGDNNWFWDCVGQNTYWKDTNHLPTDTVWCFAPRTTPLSVYPVCGSATSTTRALMPTSNLCSTGIQRTESGTFGPTADGTNRWFWGCRGQNTGWTDDTAWCFAPKSTSIVYSVCGSASNVSSTVMPATSTLCSVGTVATSSGAATDGSNQWFWGCVGQNTGWADDTAWCFAPRTFTATSSPVVIYPACSTTKNICSLGILGSTGSTADNRWYWACKGQNTGWTDDTAWCFANK